MSPTEFSNYIKQRQQLQQNNTYHHQPNHHQNMYGLSVSPARSMSPNPVALQISSNDPFVFPSNGFNLNMYQSFGSPRNMFEGINGGNYNQYNNVPNVPNVGKDAFVLAAGKCSSIMDQQSSYCKIPSQQLPPNSQATLQATQLNTSISKNNGNSSIDTNSSNNLNPQSQLQDSKLLDGISSFYSSSNPSYQHLLVAN